MEKFSSKQTKGKKNQMLWQEITENDQEKISGGSVVVFVLLF